VLDVGTFDGFYAFLAEHRRAADVVAVDNEQYVAWVRARWGIELQAGEGFATIAELLRADARAAGSPDHLRGLDRATREDAENLRRQTGS
jgi:hypothetical protein